MDNLARKIIIADPRRGLDIDASANMINRRFQPATMIRPIPFDVEEFFEFDLEKISGVKPDYRKLPYGIYGITDSDKMLCVISSELMEDHSQTEFARSTIAHEIGHVMTHVPEFRRKKAILRSINDDEHMTLRLHREENVPVYQNPEWQAWRYAGALLMPEHSFRIAVRNGADERDLAEIFKVNKPFVQARARALKIKI
jgi:hypothetical protein